MFPQPLGRILIASSNKTGKSHRKLRNSRPPKTLTVCVTKYISVTLQNTALKLQYDSLWIFGIQSFKREYRWSILIGIGKWTELSHAERVSDSRLFEYRARGRSSEIDSVIRKGTSYMFWTKCLRHDWTETTRCLWAVYLPSLRIYI